MVGARSLLGYGCVYEERYEQRNSVEWGEADFIFTRPIRMGGNMVTIMVHRAVNATMTRSTCGHVSQSQ